jgi:cytochrome c biogenesis protein CcmG/thiol:disulfide interchange protein DsbE
VVALPQRRTRSLAASLAAVLAGGVIAAACSGGVAPDGVPPLPATTPEEVTALLAAAERPVVLNVWASWCIPCRSEAPLLERAAAAFAGRVDFVGVNVRDDQDDARAFIAEFAADGAAITYLFDRDGVVPTSLGGTRGVPLTFFFAPSGAQSHLHTGVIDERTLALQIDELLAGSG